MWYSRDYLPHYHKPGLFQLITFRLVDSMPQEKVANLLRSKKFSATQKRNAMEDVLDFGYGACYLQDDRVAGLAQDSLLFFDGERYNLLAWVVMPNHVHLLVQFNTGFPLNKVVHSWKSFIANKSNKLLGRSGPFWQREYYERYIKNENHYRNAVMYIESNPVKAGLVGEPELWKYGSARLRGNS